MAAKEITFISHTMPIMCPFCGSPKLHRLLKSVHLSAEVDGDQLTTGAVAWSCVDNGHVFILREADLRETLGRLYKSQIPVTEQALDTAALMLGSEKSRGYCLENGNSKILLCSMLRLVLLPASGR